MNEGLQPSRLCVLLVCFDEHKAAGRARGGLAAILKAQGDDLLDTAVLEVNAKGKASVRDPHRVLWGAVTPAIVWGLFGLVLGSDGVASGVFWAVIGAICGAAYDYYYVHHLSKAQLARIGSKLPPQSSALAMFVETKDAPRMLEAAAAHQPSVASAAVIDDDLTAHEVGHVERPHAQDTHVLSMVALRYPDPRMARPVAKKMTAHGKGATSPFEVELLIRCDENGRRHVVDPTFGVAGFAPADVAGWAGLGLIFGAVVGAVQGGGWLGVVEEGVWTAIVWGIFGVVAGTLYGLLAGRTVSARKLRRVGPILAPGTSLVLAWSGQLASGALDAFVTPDSRQLVLHFDPVDRGVVLETTRVGR